MFVSDRNIAPREDVKKFAIAPEIPPVVFLGLARFDDQPVCAWGSGFVRSRSVHERKTGEELNLKSSNMKAKHGDENVLPQRTLFKRFDPACSAWISAQQR